MLTKPMERFIRVGEYFNCDPFSGVGPSEFTHICGMQKIGPKDESPIFPASLHGLRSPKVVSPFVMGLRKCSAVAVV